MKIFLNACIIIYQVEAAEPFYSNLTEKINAIIKDKKPTCFAVSGLSILECMVKPLRENDVQVIRRYEQFFTGTDLEIIEISPEIIDMSTRIRAYQGLRTPDSIQAASALSIKGKHIFVTGDAVFKKVPGLNVVIV